MPERVAIVAAGAGARGAYEAGALSVLLPELWRRGQRPTVFVGTSAGAINATALAALAHLDDPAVIGLQLLALWRSIDRGHVFRSLVTSGPPTALRYAAAVAGLPIRLTALLDASPMTRTAATGVDWRQLEANIMPGVVDALAVVATSAQSRSTVFVARSAEVALPADDDDRALDYVDAVIGAPHVLASCAIPLAFPAVRIAAPEHAAGWYTDGGVRLNVPLKPALALGAERLAIVATHPDRYPSRPSHARLDQPDAVSSTAGLLDAALSDAMVEDMRTLDKVNVLVAQGAVGSAKREYRIVPYVFVGPKRRAELGAVAAEVFRERYGGLRGARSPDFWLLRRLIAGEEPGAGTLLSYLFFEPEFIERSIELGRRDARNLLHRGAADPGAAIPLPSRD
jgi:NTE family protein